MQYTTPANSTICFIYPHQLSKLVHANVRLLYSTEQILLDGFVTLRRKQKQITVDNQFRINIVLIIC